MTLTRSQKFFIICLSFLGGIIVGEFFTIPLICFLLFLATSFLISKFKFFRLVCLCLVAIAIGICWRNQFNSQYTPEHIQFYNNEIIEFSGIVSPEPDIRLDHQKLTIEVQEYKGRVLVKALSYPEYQYGDLISVKCKLQAPEPIEDFKYDKFLALKNIYSVCYNPKIKLIASNQGNFFYASIIRFKQVVERKMAQTISEPQASLLGGILLGSRRGLPDELTEQFNRTGISHIIAISGYNITIIVSVLMTIAKNLYINRKKVLWFIVPILIIFVILTGMSASVVRATIMGLLVVLAGHCGRKGSPQNILIAAAVVMAIINPKTILWDSGFQLSFLATAGLMFLSPLLQKYLVWVPEKFSLQENLTSTLSAILITLPLILYNFKRLSIVAPVVNLLILPVIPLAMLTGFIQTILAFFSLILGQIFGWITWLLLSYLLKVVSIFSKLKLAAVNCRISFIGMLILAVTGSFLIWYLSQKKLGKSQFPC